GVSRCRELSLCTDLFNMKRILFASLNKGKYREASAIAQEYNVALVFPEEVVSEAGSEPPRVEENATTYEGNARLKAHAFCSWSGIPSLADDSGIEVDALHGAPG